MNGKLILGISFQVIQFLILGILGMSYLFNGLNISKELYILIFGTILILGMNVLSILLIVLGMKE